MERMDRAKSVLRDKQDAKIQTHERGDEELEWFQNQRRVRPRKSRQCIEEDRVDYGKREKNHKRGQHVIRPRIPLASTYQHRSREKTNHGAATCYEEHGLMLHR